MKPLKLIKSFVKRERPLSSTKQKTFDTLWPKHGLNLIDEEIKPKELFGRENKLNLEIGFGNGETLFSLAQKHPDQDFIGIEVYKPGIAHLFSLIENNPLDNIRAYNEDAVEVLEKNIPDKSLDKVLILFPDPWHKKKHHKRRLIQPRFIGLLAKKLKPNGILHIATDWENYAQHIAEVLKSNDSFSKTSDQERIYTTKFENRGQKLGHSIFDMTFINS